MYYVVLSVFMCVLVNVHVVYLREREEDAFDGHWLLLGCRFGQFFSINRSLVIALFRIAQV